MKIFSFILGVFLSTFAFAQTPCFSPSCGLPTQPFEICFPNGCTPVSYYIVELFVIATAEVPGTRVPAHNETCAGLAPCTTKGSRVLGWSGECDLGNINDCPDIYNQAYNDLVTNAKRINRAYRQAGF